MIWSFLKYVFDWRIIALQYYVDLCHTWFDLLIYKCTLCSKCHSPLGMLGNFKIQSDWREVNTSPNPFLPKSKPSFSVCLESNLSPIIVYFELSFQFGSLLFLPGSVLEPGFTTRPRARIISTSSCPFLSIIPTWMSPNSEWGRNKQALTYKSRQKNACVKDLGLTSLDHFPCIFLNSNIFKNVSMISYFKKHIN